ncbi:hypothetical protein N0V94_008077 [Neodidymelliopsis sp. IMI 364377]|nr:hypothetical protein N0V94_008077 [Neodidymelliopsis sp. IMI 364377]
MDPESVAFQPRDDFWRVQSEMLRVQQSQVELSERVSRLERKQDEDSRLKNVWGTSSPFPSVLGGTPQQDLHLIEHLGFQDQIINDDNGSQKIKLTVYLPEAVPVSISAQADNPAPQLPSITVDFTVTDEYDRSNPKAIHILIGSDLLRAHNADVLFSSNQLIIYDDDRSKLQVPLVRPENDSTFKFLSTSQRRQSTVRTGTKSKNTAIDTSAPAGSKVESLNLVQGERDAGRKLNDASTAASSDDGGSSGRRSLEHPPYPTSSVFTRAEPRDQPLSSPVTTTTRSGPQAAMLNSWRRDTGEKASGGSLDWANVGKTTASPSSQQRREIKVLRPTRSSSRTFSTSASASGTGQSRFFDDGKRKDDSEATMGAPAPSLARSVSGEKDENRPGTAKPRSANPVGGASAFAWLKSGSK